MWYLGTVSKTTELSQYISKANHSTSQQSKSMYAPTTNVKEPKVEQFYDDLQDFLELTPKKMSFSSEGTGM